MGRYIEEIIQPGERLLYSTTIHWIVYLRGLVALAAALVMLYLARASDQGTLKVVFLGLFIVLGLYGSVSLLAGWFRRWTTEIDVTDRRVVIKRGFIERKTTEMHMDKIESVDVSQSIMGRLMDYGEVTIRGVGVGLEPLPSIGAPLKLRSHITAQ